MTTICFPHHNQGEFNSLQEAVSQLKDMRYGWGSYVLFAIVQYNICYRDHLRKFGTTSLLSRLIEEVPQLKEDEEALNHLCEGWKREGLIAPYDIQCYPINETITVLNHTFLSKTPISQIELKEKSKTYHQSNNCMVHERIPLENLPILYYSVYVVDNFKIKKEMRQTLMFLLLLFAFTASASAQDNYYLKKAQEYQRDAEYYQKKAEGYRRDAAYYLKKAEGYQRDAAYYTKRGDLDRARTYTRYAENEMDNYQTQLRYASGADEKAAMYLAWAADALKKV